LLPSAGRPDLGLFAFSVTTHDLAAIAMANTDFRREFDFLPNLPKSNLDDRAFNDLVQECKLRIPRYCQEWTNHNPSDPGITLIELFAWLVDQMLLRFNQVPRLQYVAFLELLGIRLRPPTAAQTGLTFYLTRPVVAGGEKPVRVAKGSEVATLRTETEPAVVFTTDDDLVVGQPVLRGLFTAREAAAGVPASEGPENPVGGTADWGALGDVRLFPTSEPGNCVYLVLATATRDDDGPELTEGDRLSDRNGHRSGAAPEAASVAPSETSITGTVLALSMRGVVAGSTGIDPNNPPLVWERWDGDRWRSGILRSPQDDRTKGFSFHELQEQGVNLEDGADVILHLPQARDWPEAELVAGYRGHWIRCVYRRTDSPTAPNTQGGYSYSPIINRIGVRAIGGVVNARECLTVSNEFLGISNGKPGQTFQLEGFPVLERDPEREYVVVKLPEDAEPGITAEVTGMGGDRWQEVADFSESDISDLQGEEADKRHYTLDSRTGTLQFGPLIYEPSRLKHQTLERTRLQPWGKETQSFSTRMEPPSLLIAADDAQQVQRREWQYGKIPPRGAEIYMSAYRVGGGSRGNVQAHTLTVPKTAIPYVKSVTNHQAATGGRDAESLDEAVLRVPQVLRTAKSAMIPEDFETVAKQAHPTIYRAHCLPCTTPGIVRLLVVPNLTKWKQPHEIDLRSTFPYGMHPDTLFALDSRLRDRLVEELDERKPLGVQVRLEPPNYVGVSVQVAVLLHPSYRSPSLQPEILTRIRTALYRFLNPLTGGFDRKGWELGRSLSASDIIAQLQDIPEVQSVGNVQLYALRRHPIQGWFRSERPEPIINPGPLGLLCAWDEAALVRGARFDSGHDVQFLR
ncbi:MAG: putative baseplate assembly protein, partial [Elainellaceae cyanobacterium]